MSQTTSSGSGAATPRRSRVEPSERATAIEGASTATPQPTSVPGHPTGIHGPPRPIQRPLAFSMIENIPKPWSAHEPAIIVS
jgi:hypothetical protein